MTHQYKIAALIPTHNHHLALRDIMTRLTNARLFVVIVDDGSRQDVKDTLQSLKTEFSTLHVITLDHNQGKGVALHQGMKWLFQNGYTHAFQIDADGQHALNDLDKFISTSKINPHALISGNPRYDDSIPMGRKIGRWVTHFWVWVETLSFQIKDSMCGFRIYPLESTLSIMESQSIGARMDFDTDIMVRLFWKGIPTLMLPLKVIYPENNTSNFKMLADNWRITKMHTKLCFMMLTKLPSILKNRPDYRAIKLQNEEGYWSKISERGTVFGLYFLAYFYRLLGKKACLILGKPIIWYLYMTGHQQRKAAHTFLKRVFLTQGRTSITPKTRDALKLYMNFFETTLDRFAAWTGGMGLDHVNKEAVASFRHTMTAQKGGMLLVSHLGNMEFCRAVASTEDKRRLHVLVHTKNSERLNRLFKTFNPSASMNLIDVTNVGADTMIWLKECIEKGDWVVITADRVPVENNNRVCWVPFLGKNAPFSQGAYIMASLLECPVYTAFAFKENGSYSLSIQKFEDSIKLNRQTRMDDLQKYASQYAHLLEHKALHNPYQWYNLYDFWGEQHAPSTNEN